MPHKHTRMGRENTAGLQLSSCFTFPEVKQLYPVACPLLSAASRAFGILRREGAGCCREFLGMRGGEQDWCQQAPASSLLVNSCSSSTWELENLTFLCWSILCHAQNAAAQKSLRTKSRLAPVQDLSKHPGKKKKIIGKIYHLFLTC